MATRNKEEEINQRTFVRWFGLIYSKYRKLLTLGSFGENVGPKRMNMLKNMGLTAGFPDLVLYLPRGEYHALFIEMKSNSGRVQTHQKEIHEALKECGYSVHVARSWSEAKEITDNYLSS